MYVLSVYMCEATVTRCMCCLYACVKLLLLGVCIACTCMYFSSILRWHCVLDRW